MTIFDIPQLREEMTKLSDRIRHDCATPEDFANAATLADVMAGIWSDAAHALETAPIPVAFPDASRPMLLMLSATACRGNVTVCRALAKHCRARAAELRLPGSPEFQAAYEEATR